MRNDQPPTAEPTLAAFREYLLDTAREGPLLENFMLRAVVSVIDSYAADKATTGQQGDRADPLNRRNLFSVASAYRNANQPQRAPEGDLDRLLDDLSNEFGLTDVRIIRGVAAALADAMPRIAYKAREEGLHPDKIADRGGYTSSRIAQFLRQEKERRAAIPLTRYTWRIDTLDADNDRYEWTDREHGADDAIPVDLPRLAERLLAETGARDQHARIFLWEGDEDDDAAAVHSAERDEVDVLRWADHLKRHNSDPQ
ncbi:hypothetical protein ABZT26_13025 [Streptomyces sp. NPDC005395]|uniref:hypothetical protein n=1 Tax=Streptomyces sp. NPDC005395 TaxID=3157042 RepID=UPI0033BA8A11